MYRSSLKKIVVQRIKKETVQDATFIESDPSKNERKKPPVTVDMLSNYVSAEDSISDDPIDIEKYVSKRRYDKIMS